VNEQTIERFWQEHPCGDSLVGGLQDRFSADYGKFFESYDSWRYSLERHIPGCLDQFDWRGKRVLEIGLGQGAESEQLIRRGALWSGVDLTEESIDRVGARLEARGLHHEHLRQGSVMSLPFDANEFDIVFSHGVLHHVPDILGAQEEIHRVLRPGGRLVMMLYARRSLNYQVSIRLLRRAIVAGAYPLRHALRHRMPKILASHLANAEALGLRRYLRLETFTHHSTDGPENPFARVYSIEEVKRDFPLFRMDDAFQRFMHAPPLPVHRLPGGSRLGWHLWVSMTSVPQPAGA